MSDTKVYSFDDVTVVCGQVVGGVPAPIPLKGLASVEISLPNKKWEIETGNKGHSVFTKNLNSGVFEAKVNIKTGNGSLDLLSTYFNDGSTVMFGLIDENGTTVFEASNCKINFDGFTMEEKSNDTSFTVIGIYDILNRGGN